MKASEYPWPYDPLSGIWKLGRAYGHSNIKDDSMSFIYLGETFTFPAMRVAPLVRWNGSFYEADVDDLRKLEAEMTGEK